ncbi:YbfB/YjiJ family MFS transporter [Pontibacter sp. JAM-7]|uniref:YbfB/YjiJ family MFS transporter n=1 Tax=Pontibacter sp. JAM-7 TaxID=3366581 RepID=UPI003AF4E956
MSQMHTPHDRLEKARVLTAGLLSLILMLGIARFAYTPLLPVMMTQTGLGDAMGGWLATINYMGYMTGAVVAASVSNLQLKDTLYRIGLVVALITTAGMALADNIILWSVMRFFAGLSSAAGLLIGSGLVLNWLMRHHYRSELGLHFAGVGLGIAFVSVAVLVMSSNFNWAEQWWMLTAIGVLIAIPAWRWLPRPPNHHMTSSGQAMVDNPPTRGFMRLMLAAYFCAGYGYVISATFIVAIVERQPTMQGKGELVFLLMGLAAAPACILWDHIARRIGELNALLIAYVLQFAGIALPAMYDNLTAALFGAVLFGGTFIGIVSLVLTMAGRFYPTKPAKLMGKMTLSYGVAQILGPFLTGILAEQLGSYNLGLWLAAGFTILGSMLILLLRLTSKKAGYPN